MTFAAAAKRAATPAPSGGSRRGDPRAVGLPRLPTLEVRGTRDRGVEVDAQLEDGVGAEAPAGLHGGHRHIVGRVAQRLGDERQVDERRRPVGALGAAGRGGVGAVQQQVGVGGEQADDVERRARGHHAVDRHRAVGRPPAVDPAVARRDAHRPAGVGAEREIGEPGGDRCRRPGRRTAGHPAGRVDVARRAVVRRSCPTARRPARR